MYKLLDLYCGAGGMSEGFRQAGFIPVIAIDSNKSALDTYSHNFPKTKTIKVDVFKKPVEIDEEIDVLAAHIPQQSPIEYKKHLLYRTAKIINQVKPKYFVIEVMPEVIKLKGHEAILHDFIRDVVDQYEVKYRICNAALYGVPQDQERGFILGSLNELPMPEFPHVVKRCNTVWDAIRDLPDPSRFSNFYSLDTFPTKDLWGLTGLSLYASKLHSGSNGVLSNSSIQLLNEATVERFKTVGFGQQEEVSKSIRLHPHKPSPPITGSRLFPIHPYSHRRLTTREVARLQSFPDTFTFYGGRTIQRRLVGNATPPLMAKAIAKEIKKCLKMISNSQETTSPSIEAI